MGKVKFFRAIWITKRCQKRDICLGGGFKSPPPYGRVNITLRVSNECWVANLVMQKANSSQNCTTPTVIRMSSWEPSKCLLDIYMRILFTGGHQIDHEFEEMKWGLNMALIGDGHWKSFHMVEDIHNIVSRFLFLNF